MDKKSIFLALFIFFIIALAFYFTIDDNAIRPNQPQKEEKEAEEQLEEVNFSLYNDGGKYEIKIESKKVDNFKAESKMHLRPIYAEVYSTATGKLLYTLEGDFARYYTKADYLEVRGNVVLDSDRYHIVSDELDYYLDQNQLQGRGSVIITGNDFVSRADSFNSNLNLNDLQLSKEKNNSQKAEIKFNEFTEESNDD